VSSSRIINAENLDADIVVVGGGGCGLAAAVAAAEKGAYVVLLEKRRTVGGSSVMAEGLFAAKSPVQKRMKIDARSDTLFRIAMDYAHWQINPRIVRAFIDKSGDTIDWLQGKGMHFRCLQYYPNNCICLGVRVLENNAVKKILTDTRKRVTGVVAATKGKKRKVTAKSVIIATGGYGGNKKLLRKYYPYYNEHMVCLGVPHMGDGLIMATELGAATEGLGILHLAGNAPRGSFELEVVAEEPNTIWLNKKGERFIDEAAGFKHFESTNALVRQPGGVGYILLDEGVKRDMMEKGVMKGLSLKAPRGTKLARLGEELALASEKDKEWVRISHSWNELAGWIGAKPEVMKNTIDEYNSFCDQGYDTVFTKDREYLVALRTPPYYALRCYARFMGTIGGIKINHHMEVLDHEDNPIPGLYAGGNDTGGWETETYNVELAGTTLGFAINSGRIAGENAARYALGN
jgi:fumarate reductase flavoprotein subunit